MLVQMISSAVAGSTVGGAPSDILLVGSRRLVEATGGKSWGSGVSSGVLAIITTMSKSFAGWCKLLCDCHSCVYTEGKRILGNPTDDDRRTGIVGTCVRGTVREGCVSNKT